MNMSKISVVIICRNEVDVIARTLQSLAGLTDDIIVYDNGSTDGTQEVVRKFNAKLYEGRWEGFGKTKTTAGDLAKYDWILSLDADEAIDDDLKASLLNLPARDGNIVYDLAFKNFLGKKHLRFGEWGGDHHIRVFNRKQVKWNDAAVHESLVLPEGVEVKKLKGYVLHQTMKDVQDYAQKMVKYAMLNAEKYQQIGKKASWFKIWLSPGFTFINYYILKLGFLDGYEGFICAKMTAWYTYLKYTRLRELSRTRS
jgi:glycosyltransferase involved in cell wall biosynthesis